MRLRAQSNYDLGTSICTVSLCLYGAIIFLAADVAPLRLALIFGQILVPTLTVWFLFGIAICGYIAVREKRKGASARPTSAIAEAVRGRWHEDRLFWFWWPVLLYSVLLTLFALFKQRVLPLAPFAYDPLFYAADRAIFGVDPWKLSHGRPWLTEFFGQLYYGWYAPLLFGTLGCSFIVKQTGFRQRYLTAFVLTWLLVGSLMAFLLPAAGPCYWGTFVGGPDPYQPLMDAIRSDVANATWYNPVLDIQGYLLESYHDGKLSIGAGISAMPSMHVALATLFACGAWTLNRYFGVLLAFFAVGIWWASIHLGWHYAVDGLIAAPAALLIWLGTGRLFAETGTGTAQTPAPTLQAAE